MQKNSVENSLIKSFRRAVYSKDLDKALEIKEKYVLIYNILRC